MIRSIGVRIEREKAKSLQVPLRRITDALQVYMCSLYMNDFDFSSLRLSANRDEVASHRHAASHFNVNQGFEWPEFSGAVDGKP
jgi:hypothetical protein